MAEPNTAEYGAHPTHCCGRHGCKYASEDCPVVSGVVQQESPCESCLSPDDARRQAALDWWQHPEHQEFVNNLLDRAPDAYDGDDAAESIALAYVRDLEGFVRWALDEVSVCVDDDFPSPVTISSGTDWVTVPEQFHRIVRAYAEAQQSDGSGDA